MNQIEFGLFLVYAFSILTCGIGIYCFVDKGYKTIMNRCIFLGESLLLGSILVVGELLFLSIVGLYKKPYLWTMIILNFLFLFNKDTRRSLILLVAKRVGIDLALIGFIGLFFLLFFRNCYFLSDIDSHVSYLFTQKLWLTSGSSIVGDRTTNCMIFYPQFDTIPYSLGLSVFNQETLFPEFVNLFWRLLVVILIFGYTSFCFNRYYGLAAAMFVTLNDHFFYSGVNQWVLLNGALIAFLFAAAYNFWESKRQDSSFRFMLALIFLSQLMANKYQIVYSFIFLAMFGVLIQHNLFKKIKEIANNKKWIMVIMIAVLFTLLWYLKNMIITGIPTFPVFAGRFSAFNWSPEQERVFMKVCGGLKFGLFIKYMNYLFIWPGINAAKIVITVISFLPFLIFMAITKNKIKNKIEHLTDLCFWLSISILTIMGNCLASHWEPRYYRYSIAILSFSAVLSIHYVLSYCFKIRNKVIITSVILFLSLRGAQNEGYRIPFDQGGFFNRPTFKENIKVILNKIHTDYAIKRHYPQTFTALDAIKENKEKLDSCAWDIRSFNYISAFMLPIRPVVSLWNTNTIKWNSYVKEELIVKDLKTYGLKWVMERMDSKVLFATVEEYAKEAVGFERYLKKTYQDYNLPPELSDVKW